MKRAMAYVAMRFLCIVILRECLSVLPRRSYMYYQDIDTSSASIEHKSVEALCNALVVVGFVACLTFGIVLLYKFDCIKFFLGYCVFYSATLLGLVGAKIAVIVLCNEWHWVVDVWSLGFVMYNFAVVGVLSIFYQKGTPAGLEQGYLVTTSVIVAWQLSQLPEVCCSDQWWCACA